MGRPSNGTNIPCIYELTSNITGKIYVGQTRDLTRRIQSHRGAFRYPDKMNPRFMDYGYGKMILDSNGQELDDACMLRILEKFEYSDLDADPDILNRQEKYWINKFDSTNPSIGYNTEEGGGGKKAQSRPTINYKAPNTEEVCVLDNTNGVITRYKTCSEFGAVVNMDGIHIAERARSAHLARDKRYFIFFVNRKKRVKALTRYFKKIYPKLINDIANPLDRINTNAGFNHRINYMVWYMRSYIKVVNYLIDSGDTSPDELGCLDLVIDHLLSMKKSYVREEERIKHRRLVSELKDKGIPITDDSMHRGRSVILYSIKTQKITSYNTMVVAAEKTGISHSYIKDAARSGKLMNGEYYAYYADRNRITATFEKVWSLYKKSGKSIKNYATGYLMTIRYLDSVTKGIELY